MQADIALRLGLAHGELAVAANDQVACTGRHITGQFDPYAGLGADQADGPGVHAAQRRAVDGQGGGVAVIGFCRGLQTIGINLIAPGDDVELLGVDIGVDFGAAGDQVELADIAGVKPGALHGDAAAIDVIAGQATRFDLRFASA